jgi:hypothetical protein
VAARRSCRMVEVPVAAGGDCQLICDGEGGVVSGGVPCASVVALAVGDRLFRFPAASCAITLYE